MANFAVIKTGGKQYKVALGDILKVERLNFNEGQEVSFDTLLLAQEDKVTLGHPFLGKTKVWGKVLGEEKDKKIRVIKFKAKSRYNRTKGHRQVISLVRIEKIT